MSFRITKEDERRSREVFEARRAKYAADNAKSTPAVERLRQTIAQLEAKRPAPATAPPPKQYPPGPLVREAEKVAEAIRQARQGNIGQASAPNGAHKLPRHVVRG